ncbi:MAG TPA: class I SAM-dependent methyltransferase [Candidatus Bathyarchaeota archaeon]|nr:class I SAM-dependent methyltransferase [Candidatus Bathyarchaeota archaeon]
MKKGIEQKDVLNVEKVFDVFAERYDAWYDEPFGKSAFKLEKACIESLCKNLEQPFLEVGVGTGRFAQALKIEYGIDVSNGVLNVAKQKGVTTIKGAGESLPSVASFFGAVFLVVTLCFVEEPLKVLKETSRVLKEDGAIILGLIFKGSPWARFYKEKGDAGNVFYRIAKFYSLEKLKATVEKAGLEISEISSTMFQAPTEIPLHFEPPKSGYFEEAGFVALKLEKVNPEQLS